MTVPQAVDITLTLSQDRNVVAPATPDIVSSDGENPFERRANEESLYFRPSHHHLDAPTLKRSTSISSISSYASSIPDTSKRPGNSTPDSDVSELALGESGAIAQNWFASGTLSAEGRWFKDEQGRICLLRGVNLCGHSKLPTVPNGSTYLSEGFFDHRNVSFIGRPFPLDEAAQHFARLKTWGLTFVRLLVPWEALEHAGPGIYDDEFIDYLIGIIEEMPKYGIKCFIDPHQDAWSRFSGGSGAPGWTFEVAGMDITNFKATGAAYVQNVHHQAGDPPQPMVWPTNYTKLASSTMFTLFWAGDVFAPNATYQNKNLKEYLQGKFIDCYKYLARRLQHLDAVMGFEMMNEPHQGYIGLKNLDQFDPITTLVFGDSPSALQSFALGDGISQEIEVWVKSWPYPTKKHTTKLLNSECERAWLDGHECVWRQHGVWDVDANGKPRALKHGYFLNHPQTGKKVDFYRDFYLPFINKYAEGIQSAKQDYFIFIEPLPNEMPPQYEATDHHKGIIYAPHWYDLKSLFTKSFDGLITHDVQGLSKGKNVISSTYFGLTGAKKNYTGQVKNIVQTGLRNVGQTPCVIGECGIPMDINDKKAFETGDYTHHSNFLDAVLCAMERNLVNFTLWNYNPLNDNTHGDHWNGEDFSIYSPLPKSKTISDTITTETKISKYSKNGTTNTKTTIKQKRTFQKLEIQTTLENTQIQSSNDSDNNESAESQLSPTSPTTPFDLTQVHFLDQSDGTDEDHHHHIGGRVLDAVLRPYAAKIAGEPESMVFNLKNLKFTLQFKNYSASTHPIYQAGNNDLAPPETEIFIPNYHYKQRYLDIRVSDGDWRYVKNRQTLYWRVKDWKTPGLIHTLRVSVVDPNKVTDEKAALNSREGMAEEIAKKNRNSHISHTSQLPLLLFGIIAVGVAVLVSQNIDLSFKIPSPLDWLVW
ncbi:11275_t:CDS:2 [Ambispora gerdemannii]|uniref:11275_t:CDS:1 n=1 Tax=Ambispora gerdemannii TaxID=144530 RepID=A0A9N8V103_9GLOM|nr:11275_t:CDS:2 [Ambispora gerdemannii]